MPYGMICGVVFEFEEIKQPKYTHRPYSTHPANLLDLSALEHIVRFVPEEEKENVKIVKEADFGGFPSFSVWMEKDKFKQWYEIVMDNRKDVLNENCVVCGNSIKTTKELSMIHGYVLHRKECLAEYLDRTKYNDWKSGWWLRMEAPLSFEYFVRIVEVFDSDNKKLDKLKAKLYLLQLPSFLIEMIEVLRHLEWSKSEAAPFLESKVVLPPKRMQKEIEKYETIAKEIKEEIENRFEFVLDFYKKQGIDVNNYKFPKEYNKFIEGIVKDCSYLEVENGDEFREFEKACKQLFEAKELLYYTKNKNI